MIVRTILFLAVLCCTASAQTLKKSDFLKPQPITVNQDKWRPYGPMTILFTSACVGGQSADIISSTGYEGNSFLRGSDGRMNRGKAIPFKLAVCVAPLLFEKRLPRSGRIAVRVVQFGVGLVGFGLAGHNWKVNHR